MSARYASRFIGTSVVVAASLALILAAGAGSATAGVRLAGPRSATLSPSVPPNINATRATGNQAEQTVAVDPTDPDNIVVISNDPSPGPGLFEAYSHDGGATWVTRQIATGSDELGPACCDPSLAFDQYGNLFFTYLLSSFPNAIPVALSTDGGAHFTVLGDVPAKGKGNALGGSTKGHKEPEAGDDEGGEERGSFADQPTITTGAGSVWVTVTAGSGHIIAAGAKVTGFGGVGTFKPTQVLRGHGAHGDYGDVAIGPDGQVVLTWQYPTGGEGPAKIWMALDADGLGPQGFGKPRLLTTTNVGGFDYIPPQSGRSVDAESNMAYDRSGGPFTGRLYWIWTQEIPDESDDTDIMFQHSDDDGATWSSAVRLNDDGGTNSQFNPAIAVDQSSGAVGVSWYDARNDLGTGGPGDTDGVPDTDAQVWGAVSAAGGTSFGANFKISLGTSNAADAANGVDYGDYTHDAFMDGVFYPCWSDNSNSTGDNPDGALSKLDVYIATVS
jgi:hypothetical protein